MSTARRHAILAGVAALNVVIAAVMTPLFGAAAAADTFLVLLMIKAGVFVGLYATRSNWRQTSAGRAVMGLIACLATICAIGTLTFIFGDYPGRGFVRLFAFIAVGLTLMNLLLTLVDAQRNGGGSE